MACLLADGERIMVVGGTNADMSPLSLVETYNLKTGAWAKATKTFGEHSHGGMCVLPDTRVLVCGGYGGGKGTEVYDWREDTWWLLADMRHPTSGGRQGCSCVSVGDGTVMVMGGRGLVSCEQLDTNDNTPEVEEYDEEARRRAEAAELARDFEVHSQGATDRGFRGLT